MSHTIADLLNSDALQEALDSAVQMVKLQPDNAGARMTLATISVIYGDLKRAETHATMAARFAPENAVAYGLFRQHLRGLEARQQWWASGAIPDFPQGASEADKAAIALNVALQSGEQEKTVSALETIEEIRASRAGYWNNTAVDDLRDLDDRLPHAIEALTSGGHYLWIDLAKIAEISFKPASVPMDIVLRSARVRLNDGAEADMMIPAIYPDPETTAQQLGRTTEFVDHCGITIGKGQRSWLVGGDMQGLMSAQNIRVGHG